MSGDSCWGPLQPVPLEHLHETKDLAARATRNGYLASRSVFSRMKAPAGGLSLFSLTKCILFSEHVATAGAFSYLAARDLFEMVDGPKSYPDVFGLVNLPSPGYPAMAVTWSLPTFLQACVQRFCWSSLARRINPRATEPKDRSTERVAQEST
jgi:hypothetical protein